MKFSEIIQLWLICHWSADFCGSKHFFFSWHWAVSRIVTPNYIPDSFFKNTICAYSFSWIDLFHKFHLWLKLVQLNFCIIIYSLVYQVPFTTFDTTIIRSSHRKMFCKKGVLNKFAKLKRKYLYRSLFFNEAADFQGAILSKKRLRHKSFLPNFAKFLITPFL